jgi:tetratricopeptide (TPR) repeat protein
MKKITVGLLIALLLAGVVLGQKPDDLRSAGMDLLGALNGDNEKFERGMKKLDALRAEAPNSPAVMVLHGNGVMARSGAAFQKGDIETAMKLWQTGLDEMEKAVELAPNDVFVRARRGVMLISSARSSMPEGMAKPLLKDAVADFEKVLEIREKDQTLAQRSLHQRGEVLTGIADGAGRLGDTEKARRMFERITRDLKGSIYEQRAEAWLNNKPEAKAPEYFACAGCHVE